LGRGLVGRQQDAVLLTHRIAALALLVPALAVGPARASYTNFESSHVHPITRTPSGKRVLAVNTPDALLEVFLVQPDGSLVSDGAVPVGLEPVTVLARTDTEAWVVSHLSDSISIVDLAARAVVRTLAVGDEPNDVAFAGGFAFVAVGQEDAVKRFDLADLDAAPDVVTLLTRDVRALAVSADGEAVYAVASRSGNATTAVHAGIIFNGNSANLNGPRLAALGLRNLSCSTAPPLYPPLPNGIARNPALVDPPPSTNPAQFPPVGLIVRWNAASGAWEDEAGTNWNACLPYRLPDRDLFVIDVDTLPSRRWHASGQHCSTYPCTRAAGSGSRTRTPATSSGSSTRSACADTWSTTACPSSIRRGATP